jgi:hypothetical protein
MRNGIDEPMVRWRWAAGLVLALVALPALAQGDGVTLYRDDDYRGALESFSGDVPRLHGTRVGNDAASSLRLAPGCSVELFEHDDFRGRETVLREDAPRLAATPAGNDRVSSLRVRCWPEGPRGISLFSDVDYGGHEGVFYADVSDLRQDPFADDVASSVRVPRGCAVTLYQHPDYGGSSSTFFESNRALGDDRVGNDTVSSVRVRCGLAGDVPGPPGRPGEVLRCAEPNPGVSFELRGSGRDGEVAVLRLEGADVARFEVDREGDRLRLRPLAEAGGEVRIDLRRRQVTVRDGQDQRTLCRLR